MTPRDIKIATFAAGLAALMTFGVIKNVTGQGSVTTEITSARLFKISESDSGYPWGVECCGVATVPDAGSPIEQGCESIAVPPTFQTPATNLLNACEVFWKNKKGMP